MLAVKMPIFSVIIPCYNVELYIQETIESVLNQTFEDFECIVVNDGSSDDTLSILQKVDDPRLRIIDQINGGVSQARNIAISSALGRYIAFLDGDDIWFPFHLERAYNFFQQNREIKWYAASYISTADLNFAFATCNKQYDSKIEVIDYFKFRGQMFVWSSAIVMERLALSGRDIFPVGIDFGEDWIAWALFAENYPQCGLNFVITAIYRQRIGSLTHREGSGFRFREYAKLMEEYCVIADQKLCPVSARRMFHLETCIFWGRIMYWKSFFKNWKHVWKTRHAAGIIITIWIMSIGFFDVLLCFWAYLGLRIIRMFNPVYWRWKILNIKISSYHKEKYGL